MDSSVEFDRARSAAAIVAAGALAVACTAAAAAYPERPVRLVVPYAAGGSTDTVARIVAAHLTERLGQQFVVDNRTGAGTIIGTEIVARAAPDGYTLLMATPPLAVNPSLYRKVPYDLMRDFAPVTNIAGSSNVLVVHPTVGVNSTRELIALVKAKPGEYRYGSSGVGGAGHLAMALFESLAGVKLVHVPYKGGAPAVVDLVAGRLSLMMANLTTAQPHIRSGRLRGLGIGTRTRSRLFPELPTLIEAGVSNYEANNWNGVVVRSATPGTVIDRLQREIATTLKEDSVIERMAKAGLDPIADTPEQFGAYLRAEAEKWAQLVKTADIRAD